MAAKQTAKRRVYCDARVFIAQAEAEFCCCNDAEGGWLLLEALWRFLFSHCIFWKCVPPELALRCAGRGEGRNVDAMLFEQAAMRRALLRSGGFDSPSFARLFAAMAKTASECVLGTLKDDRYLDGTMAYFAALCDCQNGPEGDIYQPRKTHKGNWTIRDGRVKSRGRRLKSRLAAGGRV